MTCTLHACGCVAAGARRACHRAASPSGAGAVAGHLTRSTSHRYNNTHNVSLHILPSLNLSQFAHSKIFTAFYFSALLYH